MANNGRIDFGIGLDNSQLRSDAAESQRLLQGIGSTAKQEGDSIDASMKKIGTAVAGYFAVSKVKDFAVQVANVRGEFQQLEMAFKTMLGSADKADALMSQLIKTAATTPFGMSEVANGAKQLLAYGVEADKVNETLIRLGDIAAGLSIPINDLAYLYGTTMVQGRLYTQDLNQFLGRGIPLTDELAKQFGVTKDKVKELVTAGKVGFPEVEQAIISLTSEGSKFGGLMAAQSQTITGQISNIEDSIEQMFNELGKQSEGVISDTLGMVSSMIDHWQEIGKVLLTVIATYGAYKAAILAVAAAHKIATIWQTVQAFIGLTKYVTSAKDAMLLFNMVCKANPIGIVVSVLAAAATAMTLFGKNTSEADDRLKAANKTIKEQKEKLAELDKERDIMASVNEEVSQSVAGEISKIELLEHAIHDETASIADRRKAISQLQGIVPNYHATLTDEGILYEKNKQSVDDYIDSLNRLALAKALQTKREELTAQKVNAELNRRTASQNVDTKQEEVSTANSNVATEQKRYDAAMERAREATGGSLTAGFQETQISMRGASEISKLPLDAARKNAAAAKAELEAAQGKVRELDKEIKNATDDLARLDAYAAENDIDLTAATSDKPKTTTPPKKTGKGNTQQLADAAADRQQAISKYQADVIAANRQAEFEIQQKDIDAMEEGYEKQKAQIDLNYRRLTAENETRRQKMIEDLANNKVNEWLNENPTATKAQQTEYRSSLLDPNSENHLTAADLTADQQHILEEYQRIAEQYVVRANKEALNTALQDCLSYEQQRTQIAEEYAKKRSALYETDEKGNIVNGEDGKPKLKEGVSQDNISELGLQENEALAAVDEQFAQREDTYKAWCNEIANLTLEQLQAILEKAEQELKDLEKSGNGDTKTLSVARAKVNTAKSKVSEANAKQSTNPDKRSIKEWEDLYKTLNECEKEFESIGDAIGGTVGDIIKSAGQIASSALTMVNGIMQLSQGAATAIQGTSTAASTAIQTVEKASVILTIISAALQIATQIANLFNDDEEKQEEIEQLQERIDQLQWELDNAEVLRLQNVNGKAIDLINEKLEETRAELAKDAKSFSAFSSMWEYMTYKVQQHDELLKQSAAKIAQAYANMAYTADKALGGSKYSEAQAQLENIAQQQLLIQEQIDTERSKKDSDSSKITEYEQKIEELGQQALEVINEMVEDIIGGSSSDIAEQLSDAFFEAFENGEDAAEAWGDTVNDIIADIMKRMLTQKFLEEPLGEIFDKYKAQWFKDGKFVGIDAVLDSLSDLTTDLNDTYDNFSSVYEIIDQLPDELKEKILGEATREASSTGIANASQESVDELNGRATAIQGHTYSISENTKILVSTTNLILQSVLNIERNTDDIPSRLATMETDMKAVKDTVNDIALKGIKLK